MDFPIASSASSSSNHPIIGESFHSPASPLPTSAHLGTTPVGVVERQSLPSPLKSLSQSHSNRSVKQEVTASSMTVNELYANEEIKKAFHDTCHDLGCFWGIANAAMSHDAQTVEKQSIVVLSQENPNELVLVSRAEFEDKIVMEASHEKVKEVFVNTLATFIGKDTADFFYPEEEREHPLTPEKIKDVLVRVSEFHLAVIKASNDVSASNKVPLTLAVYEENFQSSFELLQKTQKAVDLLTKETPLKSQKEDLAVTLQPALGVSSETISFLLGIGAVTFGLMAVDVGTTGGVTFTIPSLLHSSGALAMLTKSTAALSGHASGAVATGNLAANASGGTIFNSAYFSDTVCAIVNLLIDSAIGATVGATANYYYHRSDIFLPDNTPNQLEHQRIARNHYMIHGSQLGFIAGEYAGGMYTIASPLLSPSLSHSLLTVGLSALAAGGAALLANYTLDESERHPPNVPILINAEFINAELVEPLPDQAGNFMQNPGAGTPIATAI